jgi:predicted phosphodiesterase
VTRLVHISDLHFGRDDAGLIAPLLHAIKAARPDLVAVSGDLTQRDVPLHDPVSRLLRPWAGYRAHIAHDLAPVHEGAGLLLATLNTADPFAWQRGRLRRRQLRAACDRFARDQGRARVLMAHHPFRQSPETKKQLMPGAAQALDRLAGCGADVVLSGHLHRWRAEPFVAEKGGGRVLEVHVGTGLSTRLRGQENDFAVLDLADPRCHLRRMVARGGGFVEDYARTFDLSAA